MSSINTLTNKVDYLVIGGGNAGCLMASRLSDDTRYSVVLLEAGSFRDNDPNIRDSTTAIQSTHYANYFWQESSTPQNGIVNSPIVQYTGGRVFGGSSSINGLQWVRGTEDLFNQWVAQTGDNSWSPNNVTNMFKQIEKYIGTSENTSSRGNNGPVTVRQVEMPTPAGSDAITQAFLNGANAVVSPIQSALTLINDYNTQPKSGPPIGVFSKWQITQSQTGSRQSSSRSYLHGKIQLSGTDPNKATGTKTRKLTVYFRSTVTKILFESNKAVGAIFIHNGIQHTVYAKQIILTSGINNAQLLQVSGVGPSSVLSAANVPVIVNNQYVGANLTDHAFIILPYLNQSGTVPVDSLNSPYFSGAFLPDLRQGVPSNTRSFIIHSFYVNPVIMGILVFLVTPKSKGSVKILTKDPLASPLVDPNYLGDTDDLDALSWALNQYVKNINDQLTAAGFINLTPLDFSDNQATREFVKANCKVSYHYAGSMKMATLANQGAVDSSGRVRGTKNLRVADASIQPVVNDGHTQSAAYLISYKISQDIINERH